jgi:hypothetical protein
MGLNKRLSLKSVAGPDRKPVALSVGDLKWLPMTS